MNDSEDLFYSLMAINNYMFLKFAKMMHQLLFNSDEMPDKINFRM